MTQATIQRTARTRKPAKKAVYQGGTLVRVYDRETKEVLGYVAKPAQPLNADGSVKVWYQVTCDHDGCWHCTCDGNAKWNRQCMHIDAAQELCEIRVKQGRPGCQAESLPVVVAALPATREVAALVAMAVAIPASPKPDRATAVLQPRGFALPPSWDELAATHKRAS
jgi:hypothetical protein